MHDTRRYLDHALKNLCLTVQGEASPIEDRDMPVDESTSVLLGRCRISSMIAGTSPMTNTLRDFATKRADPSQYVEPDLELLLSARLHGFIYNLGSCHDTRFINATDSWKSINSEHFQKVIEAARNFTKDEKRAIAQSLDRHKREDPWELNGVAIAVKSKIVGIGIGPNMHTASPGIMRESLEKLNILSHDEHILHGLGTYLSFGEFGSFDVISVRYTLPSTLPSTDWELFLEKVRQERKFLLFSSSGEMLL